ncbi:MAG: AMP-dependent synthetase and ligase [Myxococcales bacterium]|nr:AMP-dependent synthetase and ligase [Myxococcales bacterium]
MTDPAGARVVVATPTPATIAAIHLALERREPIALLHARLPEAELARQRALVEAATLPSDAAMILFTSGSTGPARGVVLSRGALEAAASASAAQLGWHDDDRWLLALPTAHAGGLAVVVRSWIAGKPIALLDGDFDRARAAALLEDCTLASLVPTQLAALLEDPAWHPPSRLRAVLLGGAAASRSLLADAHARGVPFLTSYGLTETFGQIATAPLSHAGDPDAPLATLTGVTVIAGTRAQPELIRIRGPMLATAYLDGTSIAPELTTADLGFVDDGVLHIVGRADDVIVSGGEKVHPSVVEAVLAATPGIRAACVFGVPDPRWGQIVGAAVVVGDDAPLDQPAALAGWADALPPHARPRELAITRALPLLPSGKVDRRSAARLARVPLRYRSADEQNG